MSKKSIAFVANTSWSIYKFRLFLIRHLIDKGFTVYVLAPRDAHTIHFEKIPGLTYIGLTEFHSKGLSIMQDLRLLRELTAHYRQIRPDCIFHYTIKANIWGSLAAGRAGIPSVSVITGLGYAFAGGGWLQASAQLLYRWALGKTRETWFLNEDDRQVFLRKKLVRASKAFILPGEGVDTRAFYPVPLPGIAAVSAPIYINPSAATVALSGKPDAGLIPGNPDALPSSSTPAAATQAIPSQPSATPMPNHPAAGPVPDNTSAAHHSPPATPNTGGTLPPSAAFTGGTAPDINNPSATPMPNHPAAGPVPDNPSAAHASQPANSSSPARQHITFLLIARIIGHKGIREFVEAAAILREKGMAVDLQLLGFFEQGNPVAISPIQVRHWEDQGLITYLGDTDDVAPFIAAADCIVLPSYREGMPLSLLEGASMGRALIATDVAGCRQLIRDGINGYLCSKKNGADLAQKMMQFCALPPTERQKMGTRGRELVLQHFTQEIIADIYLGKIALFLGEHQP